MYDMDTDEFGAVNADIDKILKNETEILKNETESIRSGAILAAGSN
jgi:hypothetical protein